MFDLNGLSVMGWTYLALLTACLVGYVWPSHRTASVLKLGFFLAYAVVVLVIVWYGAHMAFYYFNGGVAL